MLTRSACWHLVPGTVPDDEAEPSPDEDTGGLLDLPTLP